MDTQNHQKMMRDKVEVKPSDHHDQKGKEEGQQQSTHQPPSSSSSPTHEFSFTISLHPPPTSAATRSPVPPSIAVDLSPADDIFFHGHLLPLHLLSHLPISPRSSTNSLDSFTLPIKELNTKNPIKNTQNNNDNNIESKGKSKSKSFSLFGLPKRRKGCEVTEHEHQEKPKRKLKFDVTHVLKRYVKMVRPLLSFRWRREKIELRRQPYSFSGNLSLKGKTELRGSRGEYSAPASMRTSPANSGLLVAARAVPTSTSDSTMEELQAAIQAAIAHCKNSIAVEEKIKC